jgi:hypothetical protein
MTSNIYPQMGLSLTLQIIWILFSIGYGIKIWHKLVRAWGDRKNTGYFESDEEYKDHQLFTRLLNKPIEEISGITEFFILVVSRLINLALKMINTIWIFFKNDTLFSIQVSSALSGGQSRAICSIASQLVCGDQARIQQLTSGRSEY